MSGTAWRTFGRDAKGSAAVKLVFTSCLVAFAAVTSSPAFEANPLIGDTIGRFRQHLPETLDTIRRALGG